MSDTPDIQPADAAGVEQHGFGAEVGRLLDLVVHSLYSEREIFLRELVANAADATDRRRFESLTHPELGAEQPGGVRIVPDAAGRVLTVSDDGIGMSKDELISNLGTIARSGTRAFGNTLADAKPEDRPSLIGQFGVGFYSAFMVADRVEVTSRKAGTDDAFTWSSDGRGTFTIAPATREHPGSDVVLHIKADATEYLEPMRLETAVRKWADHITLPVTIVADGKEVSANEGTALWRKAKSDVSDADAEAFYRHLGNMFDTPAATLHWKVEGALEFYAMLFIPGAKPFEPMSEQERTSRVRLHVRRMFITDTAELLPPWLRFVQGVVDTEDLPLNVSREMLQTTPVLARIRKAVTNRVITELKSQAKDAEAYQKIWDNFGPIIKEGLWEDGEHRADIAPLLRARSSTQEGWTSLPDYMGRMKEGQAAIYFLAGDSIPALTSSPQLEGFRARGVEVLLLADPIDAFWPDRFTEFEGKPIRSVTQGAADLDSVAPVEPLGEAADTAALVAALKAALGDQVSDVRTTDRLSDSAVVLAAGAYGPNLQMQRLLRRAGRSGGPGGMMGGAPVLEINPRHPLIVALAAQTTAEAALDEAAVMLLDLARVQDGDLPKDPAGFARRVERALAQGLG
jgi:molecular chaperone HtpG